MTTPTSRPPRYLRLFAIGLGAVVLAVLAGLFGVNMEARAPAEGVLLARDAVEMRAPRPGLATLRADAGSLRPGDERAAGEALAWVRPENGDEPACVRAPAGASRWIVLRIAVAEGQAVHAGDTLAEVAPFDPETGMVPGLTARLDFREDDFGGVAVGQPVRLASPMYPSRVYGHATARVERVEPAGTPGPDGRPRFRAWATVESSPFPLRPGGSTRAEVILGRKPAWRIILEH